jgi:hypothetical protein
MQISVAYIALWYNFCTVDQLELCVGVLGYKQHFKNYTLPVQLFYVY